MKITSLAVLLIISILVLQIGLQTISVTVTGEKASANTSASESLDQSTQLLPTERVNYKPYVPPAPHTDLKKSQDPLSMAGFDVLTREETDIPSTDSSQLSVEIGASSTASYEGILQQSSPETVFLPDGRSVVPYSSTMSLPWRTICKLYVTAADGTQWMGSGCIIGPGQAGHGYHLLTAGHMVYMSDHGGWISSMEVIPGYDDYQAQLYQQMPYYHSWVTYMRSYTGWTVDQNHQDDWAVCTLDRCIGDYTGWMGRMTASSGSSIYTGVLRTAGFPGDKDAGYRMYTDSNNGRIADEYNHWYYMDTYGGQSGSPVWYNDGTSNYIITVHAYGDDGSGSNHGTRLNQDKFDRINTWLASDAPPTDKADLTDDGQAFSLFSPTTVVAGTTNFYVTCDVRNFGTSAANNFYVSYYASTDQIITSSDYLIGSQLISSISPLAYADSFWQGNFPASIPQGTYWVGWIIDSTNAVSEFDKTNNVAYKTSYQLVVQPSLPTITFYTNPTSFVASPGTITFSSTTYSNGQTGNYTSADYNATANAPSGYAFNHWEYSGSSGSGVYVPNNIANPATVQVRGTGWLKAVFSAQITFYTNPSSVGSIQYGISTYTNGQTRLETNLPPEYSNQFSVKANVPSGYIFKGWSVTGGLSVASSSINPSTITVTGPGTITAIFNSSTFDVRKVTTWYWTSSTAINSVASGDVDNDGFKEIVTGGYFFDGTRTIAQLIVWNGSNLAVDRLTTWYWTGNTTINSVAIGDVDGDNQTEIVTGGCYYDGSRNVAQLIVWNGLNLAVERLTTWYWTGNTVINSVAIANVDGDSQVEIVTGGYYNDGVRNIAQLIEWNGLNLAVDRLTTWYWTGNTVINSVALGDVDNDTLTEVVTGGYYNDGVRNIAQLVEWNGANLAVDRLKTWYWTGNTSINSVAIGDADDDGQIEVVTGGYYNDGSRNNAQLIEWVGSSLAVDRLIGWYWTSNTAINSIAIGDVDGDGQNEIVTGGYYNDGIRNIAQLTIWSGSSLAAENTKTWYWTGNTTINAVTIDNVIGDSLKEIIAGGAFYDGTRLNSQLTVWGMT